MAVLVAWTVWRSLIKAISAERGDDRVLLLDGGDLLQGSYTALMSKGADMIRVAQALGVAATTGHWEFTLGQARVADSMAASVPRAQPASPSSPAMWSRPTSRNTSSSPRASSSVGASASASSARRFPTAPIANPRWMMPTWSFGIREVRCKPASLDMQAREVDVIVLLSHNGFDVDRKLAGRVRGIDVILTGHTHDALPLPIKVGNTLLITSGSHGKFLSRLDLDVQGQARRGFQLHADPGAFGCDYARPEMAALIQDIRAPHRACSRPNSR